jgi:hypothetical protein
MQAGSGCRACLDTELMQDMFQMLANSLGGYPEDFTDFRVRLASSHPLQYLNFPRRKWLD